MENNSHRQLELFSTSRETVQRKNDSCGESLFFQIKNHEKALLITAGLIVISIISFSLGVEKGKKIASIRSHSRLDLALDEKPIKENIQTAVTAVKEEPVTTKDGYTIQLACYKTRSYADKEAQTLKIKGLTPLIQEKGDYIVLCVGNFSDKETAKILLLKLKTRYQGCYVRRI